MGKLTGLRPDIQQAVDQMGTTAAVRKDLKTLEGELLSGETVRNIVSGWTKRGNGVLVLTDRRVIFHFHGVVSHDTEAWEFSQITSIEFHSQLLLATIDVHAAGSTNSIKNIDKREGDVFVKAARSAISNAALPSTPARDTAEQLLQLKQLLDAGILTQSEFDAKAAPLKAQL